MDSAWMSEISIEGVKVAHWLCALIQLIYRYKSVHQIMQSLLEYCEEYMCSVLYTSFEVVAN